MFLFFNNLSGKRRWHNRGMGFIKMDCINWADFSAFPTPGAVLKIYNWCSRNRLRVGQIYCFTSSQSKIEFIRDLNWTNFYALPTERAGSDINTSWFCTEFRLEVTNVPTELRHFSKSVYIDPGIVEKHAFRKAFSCHFTMPWRNTHTTSVWGTEDLENVVVQATYYNTMDPTATPFPVLTVYDDGTVIGWPDKAPLTP